jgi:hypothetical protein
MRIRNRIRIWVAADLRVCITATRLDFLAKHIAMRVCMFFAVNVSGTALKFQLKRAKEHNSSCSSAAATSLELAAYNSGALL